MLDRPIARKRPDLAREIGLEAVERLQIEARKIYADIDAETRLNATQKLACYSQVLGVFAGWFLGAMPPPQRVMMLGKIAAAANKAALGAAPTFH
jgi:hypothetical protein